MNQPEARPGLAREEKFLRLALIAGAVLFALEAAIYVPEVFSGPPATRPFAINSVAKDVLFATITALAAADLARRARLISLVVLGHVVIVFLLVLAIVTGDSAFTFPPPDWLADLIPALDPSEGVRATVWLIGASVATATLIWLLHRALSARHDLRFLWPFEHATLAAVAEAILRCPVVPPVEVATAVDHYWAMLDISYKRRLRLSLWVVCFLPLLFFRLPFPLMEVSARRRFLRRRFEYDVAYRKDLGLLRGTVQSAFRFPQQLVYVGYYNDPRSFATTGYQPYTARPNFPSPPPPRPDPKLRVIRTPRRCREGTQPDVLVIGTGAGGAMVAHVLAERGHDVLMVDRGRYVRPSQYVESEAEQYAQLYSDGALQLSRDFSFQILQGMCVGGSTVVNNGVSFAPPAAVLPRWNGPEFDAGLDDVKLDTSFVAVRQLMGIVSQAGAPPNPIIHRVSGFNPVDANLDDCLGTGYCNIGCPYGRKLSMLWHLLPKSQQDTDARRDRDPNFKGRLEIIERCEVTKILQSGGRVTGARCVLRRDDGGTHSLDLDADIVVLAAGCVHSSRLLMASGLGGPLVGQGLSANLGSHMTAYWPDREPLRAFAGLQMSHYLPQDDAAPYRIETWFNPVMSQALVMPGWLDDHERNMRRYDHLGCLGVIAGSTRGREGSTGTVLKTRNLLSGAEVDFKASEHDLRSLLAGLRHAGRLLLDAGAECVMPATFLYHEMRTAKDLERLDLEPGLIKDMSDISVNTGHPQGGNPMSQNPKLGVVDETFRVHGLSNLHVCDASVFPDAITVNPQLTVMALAHYAATHHIGR